MQYIHRRNWLKYGAAGVAGIGIQKVFDVMSVAGDRFGGSLVDRACFQAMSAAGSSPSSGSSNGDVVTQPIRENLGRYIFLTPAKLGGGNQARGPQAAD